MRSVSCAWRRQLLLAGLEVQFIAARRILGDGDDRCFTVFALGTLNALLALFTGIALLALRTLNTLLSLRSRTAAVALHTLWTDLVMNMQEDKEAVFDCVDTVKMCLRVFTPMIAAMKACTCNMYRAAQRGFLNATDLADYLTKKGLPFRAAYKIAGQLVAYCIEHIAVLEELPLALLRQYSERFGEDVYAAIAAHQLRDGPHLARRHLRRVGRGADRLRPRLPCRTDRGCKAGKERLTTQRIGL